VPERERLSALREEFGRGALNMDFTPLDERPRFEFEIRLLPRVAITWGYNSPHIGNSAWDKSRANDDLMLGLAMRPVTGAILQRGREIGGDGTGVFVTCAEPTVGETRSDFHFLNVRLSRQLLAQLLPNPEDRLMQPIPASNEALRLLKTYARVLRAQGEPQSPQVANAISLHIADLVALAVGTTRDAAQWAAHRGLRAARIASVKSWMLERIADPALSISAVATAHGISRRYLQMLFELEGTSFSAWLRSERLALARRRLADPGLIHRPIANIAFDCGFSDLSWFNHAFRRAYGETPSDVRHQARHMMRN
jgi:AraC-like DNA-binding protein